MKKYLIAFLIGIVATVVFGILAGFGGGACHCETPLRVLFPFLSLLESNAEAGTVLLGLHTPYTQWAWRCPRAWNGEWEFLSSFLPSTVARWLLRCRCQEKCERWH